MSSSPIREEAAEYRLLSMIRGGRPLSWRQRLELIVRLSVPAIVAQISLTVMLFVDASMVGSLGAGPAASIGLVTTTTWLFGNLLAAAATAFSVQVAHRLGADNVSAARAIARQSMVAVPLWGLAVGVAGCAVSGVLPHWLGGGGDICRDASAYFFIFSASLPLMQLNYLSGALLRVTGNMRVPSMINVLMCVLDVVFNFFFIFPSRTVGLPLVGDVAVWGAGLGVTGAALGTAMAEVVSAGLMTWYVWTRSPQLRMWGERGGFLPQWATLRNALKIGSPLWLQHIIMCGAQIMSTVIVAPLGTLAIAANSFAITAESLCYMPGFGIGEAATTAVGQSVGAGRRDLSRQLGYQAVGLGMAVMGVMGLLLYLFAYDMMGLMTPDEGIRGLGAGILRIESVAEPFFAAAIVSYGVFVGAGDTLIPSCMNFGSIWLVRISLAALLAPVMGLTGVWIAMSIELCFRGVIFLIRLRWGKWV